MNTDKKIAAAAAEFASRWKDRGYEKGDSQPFWMDLLQNVYGVENVVDFIRYEEKVKVDATNFIDGHISVLFTPCLCAGDLCLHLVEY